MIRPWVHFPEYNICMAFMPKVANTSMKMAFAELYGMSQFVKSQIGIHSHFLGAAPEAVEHLNCLKIIFTRDPFDRLVSAWQSKLIDKNIHPPWNRYGMFHGMPFKDFAKIVCNTSDKESDHHWRSQTFETTGLSNLRVYRFENIDNDWEEVRELIPGLPRLKKWGTSQKGNFRLYYDDVLVDMVARRYADDIVKLNYRFD